MSKEYSITGTVKNVQDVQLVGANQTPKNTAIFTVKDGEYENEIAIDFFKERAEKATDLNPGDQVEVFFNIRSNEGTNDRWFTNLTGWKWNKVGSTPPAPKYGNEADDLPY